MNYRHERSLDNLAEDVLAEANALYDVLDTEHSKTFNLYAAALNQTHTLSQTLKPKLASFDLQNASEVTELIDHLIRQFRTPQYNIEHIQDGLKAIEKAESASRGLAIKSKRLKNAIARYEEAKLAQTKQNTTPQTLETTSSTPRNRSNPSQSNTGSFVLRAPVTKVPSEATPQTIPLSTINSTTSQTQLTDIGLQSQSTATKSTNLGAPVSTLPRIKPTQEKLLTTNSPKSGQNIQPTDIRHQNQSRE